MIEREMAGTVTPGRPYAVALTAAWALLLLLGAFFLFAAVSDLAADARTGLPADHLAAFAQVTGRTWASAKQATPGLAAYVTLLEYAYAVHELVFGLLFICIVAIPLRRRQRWAWWACWAVLLANVTYTVTFGRHDATLLYRSLIGDIVLPLALLMHAPVIFTRQNPQS
jgi:hypothetical protein